jgi:hypothetical protein
VALFEKKGRGACARSREQFPPADVRSRHRGSLVS